MNEKCAFGGYTRPGLLSCEGFIFDKQLDKTLKLIPDKLPSVGAGTIQFVQQTPGLVWVVEVDFEPDLEPALMAVSPLGTFEYELEIAADNNSYFDQVGLAIIGPPIGDPMFTAKKLVTEVGSDVPNPPTALNVNETQRSQFDDFDGLLKKIKVVDTYDVKVGSINSIQNSYSQKEFGDPERVPGPLPLLGAGAAFAFSRRLRTRVLAARGA